jgi:hypothetical protein
MSKDKKTDEPAEEGARSFLVFLRDLGEGEAESELSYQLHELCKRIQEEASAQGSKVRGALSLKLRIVAEPKGPVGISYDVETKSPKRKTSPAVMWLTKGGNLTPDNPRQQRLGLREVGGTREVRETPVAQPANNAREV